MIRVLLVDDHPAMRTGLSAVLKAEPGIVVLGAASGADDLEPVLHRTQPDVVVLDYHLPGEDGLTVCRRLKRRIPAPAVLLYSAYADASLAIPGVLAGADGILNKAVPAKELYDAVRRVARGEVVLPAVSRELVDEALAKVGGEDAPILMMVLDGASQAEIAGALRLDAAAVSARVDRMVAALRVDVPAPAG